jgi:hypothetical protein
MPPMSENMSTTGSADSRGTPAVCGEGHAGCGQIAQFGHQEAEAFEAVGADGADGAVFDGEDWLRKFDVVDRKAADAGDCVKTL